jgi:signal transduction histidine kinase/PAS domain-containing protein
VADAAGFPADVAGTGTPTIRGVAVEVMELGGGVLTQDAADALAAVTARAAGTPTAMIHVVDGDYLGLAGGAGMPAGWGGTGRVPISSTLAGAVFAHRRPLIIEDVATDPRVPADAPVRQHGILAYAGFPIFDRDRVVVGVCGVMDSRVRRWRADELEGVSEGARACTAFVAERRAAEAADRGRRFLDALLGSLHVGVAAVDAQGQLVVTNRAIQELSGGLPEVGDLRAWAEQQRLGDAAGHPLPPDAVPLLRALRGEAVRGMRVSVDRPGERRLMVLADAQPILADDARILGAVVAVQDVTDRLRVERFHDCELAVSRALSEPGPLETAAERVLGTIAGTLGWPRAELWLVDAEAGVLRPAAVHDAGGCTRMEVPGRLHPGEGLAGRAWQDGTPVWTSWGGSGLRTALALPVPSGDRTLAVLALFADVVEDPHDLLVTLLQGPAAQIGQYLERRRAQELQLALSLTRDEYLALVGHEMRTPLTSIAAYTDLILDLDAGDFDVEGRDLARVVQRNSNHLRRIVDELLDLSALASGHAVLACQPCDIADLVRDAVTGTRSDSSDLEITYRAPGQCVVPADPARLRQVLDILVDNAVLHTEPGGRIDVELAEVPGGVELTVTDTGIGIPPEEQPKVFTRFFRSSRTREHGIRGAGLGLAISQAIIERHHGTLRLLPDHQPGTSVRIRLPT